MMRLKIPIYIFISVCASISCEFVSSPNMAVGNSINTDVANNQFESPKVKIKLPFQTKPRRAKINFPDDCQQIAGNGAEYLLEKTCADALNEIQPDLPKTHIIGMASPQSNSNTPKVNCDYAAKQDSKGRFDFDDYGAIFYLLSPNKYLVQVKCAAGAYNEINVYLLYNESAIPAKAEVLEFPSFQFDYDEDSDVAKTVEKVNVEMVGGRFFNPKTKELIVFEKARGIADAGLYARYSFPNDKPKLEELRAKFAWTGRGYGTNEIIKTPPATWKKYYPK